MNYSESFKRQMVQRMLGPNPISATALCNEVQIPQSTLSRWLRQASTLGAVSSSKPASPPGSARSAQDKMRLLLAYEATPEADRGAWLRTQGLHDAELAQWRQAMVEALDDPKPDAGVKGAVQSKRIRQLERELKRKEKALAEAAALLVLQKKSVPSERPRTTTRRKGTSRDLAAHRRGRGGRSLRGASVRCWV